MTRCRRTNLTDQYLDSASHVRKILGRWLIKFDETWNLAVSKVCRENYAALGATRGGKKRSHRPRKEQRRTARRMMMTAHQFPFFFFFFPRREEVACGGGEDDRKSTFTSSAAGQQCRVSDSLSQARARSSEAGVLIAPRKETRNQGCILPTQPFPLRTACLPVTSVWNRDFFAPLSDPRWT
jgi:hypothetical protein